MEEEKTSSNAPEIIGNSEKTEEIGDLSSTVSEVSEEKGNEDDPNSIGDYRYNDTKTGRFKEGNPGGGRPKGSISVVDALKKKLEEVPEGQKRTYLEMLITKIMQKALQEGDSSIIRDIIDRIDGKPLQRTENKNDHRFQDIDDDEFTEILEEYGKRKKKSRSE